MTVRFSEIDDGNRADHTRLGPGDRCLYLFEYTSGRDYSFSATNNLINNLKKKPTSSESQRRYKAQAIAQCGGYFREGLDPAWLARATLVPIPGSKAADHPDFDDRMTQVARAILPGLDVRPLVRQTQSLRASHEVGDGERVSVDELLAAYQIDETIAQPAPVTIGIMDDVLTAGTHYRAMRTVLAQRFPAATIFGLFVDHFDGQGHGEEIIALLKGRPEFQEGPDLDAAEALIGAEVDHKLAAYFTILDREAPIELGGYRYDQAYAVYRHLMIKALYHRYQAEANDEVGLVYIEPEVVEAALSQETGIDRAVVSRILKDLIFDAEAVLDRVDACYFSLMKEGAAPGRIILRPIHFSLSEGLIQLLRVVAQRRPNVFLANVSNPLGSRFVARLKRAFDAQGFDARPEVSVRHIDPGLPDIDLLVISHEPTLGYVFLVCEVKSPLPPLWAKDQLKVLAPDSVSKAFRQAEAIQAFLTTPQGIGFVRGLLPDKPLEHFDDFVVMFKSLIITSDNAGMFFAHEETPVINFRTLERLLKRSDGDMLHIGECLSHYNAAADAAVALTTQSFELDGVKVSYEAASPKGLMDFPQGDWRASGRREALVADFAAGGHHPFDCLKNRRPVLMAVPALGGDDPSN